MEAVTMRAEQRRVKCSISYALAGWILERGGSARGWRGIVGGRLFSHAAATSVARYARTRGTHPREGMIPVSRVHSTRGGRHHTERSLPRDSMGSSVVRNRSDRGDRGRGRSSTGSPTWLRSRFIVCERHLRRLWRRQRPGGIRRGPRGEHRPQLLPQFPRLLRERPKLRLDHVLVLKRHFLASTCPLRIHPDCVMGSKRDSKHKWCINQSDGITAL